MSVYYSRFDLNTYCSTPYFQAQIPSDYPINLVLIKSRAFRRLPPRLQELSALAKKWVQKEYSSVIGINDIDNWYDEEGYELNPGTKQRLTDQEINAQWSEPNDKLAALEIKDIPVPEGGFADPNTWVEPPPKPDESDSEDGISEEQLIKDIASHGREYVAKESGISKTQLEHIKSDKNLVRLILRKEETTSLAIGDSNSPAADISPTLVSATELLFNSAKFPTDKVGKPPSTNEPNKPISKKDIPKKIQITTEWGKLRAAVVGSPDNDVLPTGETKEEFDSKLFKRTIKQTDKLCRILEKEGVKVFRPELIPPQNAQAEPTGLDAQWARDVFTVVGNKIIVNQLRTPHRNKDRQVIEPLFLELEHSGKAQMLYLPTTDWQHTDSDLENDPRPFLEGGDVFRLGDDVLVTISHRATSASGYQWLANELSADDINVWVTYLTPEWEHGNQVFFPIREGLCIAHPDGFENKEIPTVCEDWEVIEVTRAEAGEGFVANGLVLRKDVVLMPVGWPRIRRALEGKGVDVIEVPWDGPAAWGGGIGRAVNPLWRDG